MRGSETVAEPKPAGGAPALAAAKRALAGVLAGGVWMTAGPFVLAPLVMPVDVWLGPLVVWALAAAVAWRVARWLREGACGGRPRSPSSHTGKPVRDARARS